MNMEGLSEETLKKFLEKGFINQYPDLFRLEEHKDAILEMDGFGEKSYTNLIASVQRMCIWQTSFMPLVSTM